MVKDKNIVNENDFHNYEDLLDEISLTFGIDCMYIIYNDILILDSFVTVIKKIEKNFKMHINFIPVEVDKLLNRYKTHEQFYDNPGPVFVLCDSGIGMDTFDKLQSQFKDQIFYHLRKVIYFFIDKKIIKKYTTIAQNIYIQIVEMDDFSNPTPGDIKNIIKLIQTFARSNFQKEIKQEQVKKDLAQYVKGANDKLQQREYKHRVNSSWFIGFGIGVLSLAVGLAIGFAIWQYSITDFKSDLWQPHLFMTIKLVIVILFLAAIARVLLLLGKGHLNESIKNADRIHAIKFGEFVLRTFGEDVKYEQVVEVFQQWNISTTSSFDNLKGKDFDPRITEIILSLAEKAGKSGSGNQP